MRRSEREVKDFQKIMEILERCEVCRIGLFDTVNNEVYIVPVNFGYHEINGKIDIYFHGANEGRKASIIRTNPKAGIEFDCDHEIITSQIACSYTSNWKSIIGNGIIEVVTDPDEKFAGLNTIMKHYSGKSDWVFPKNALSKVALYKFSIEKISCKMHE